MADERRNTHPDSPVQPDRGVGRALIVGIVLTLLVGWSLRDLWVDALAPPYEIPGETNPIRSEPPPVDRAAAGPDEKPVDVKLVGGQPARGDLQGIITADDYPAEAIRRNETGDVTVDLKIGTTGRVTACTVARSSGSRSLDRRTCEILSQRGRFRPAVDSAGRPIEGRFSQRISWRLEGWGW